MAEAHMSQKRAGFGARGLAAFCSCAIGLVLPGCGARPSAAARLPDAQAVVAEPASVEMAAGSRAQLRAQVNDAKGQPIGGAPISYRSQDPALVSVTTAGEIHSLGPSGESFVTVGSGVRSIRVPIRVPPGPPAALELVRGPPAAGPVGETVAEIRVRVVDAFHNPIPGASLEWKPADQIGSVDSSQALTGAGGEGTARWQAGPKAGLQTLNIGSGSLAPLAVKFQALPGPVHTIQIKTEPTAKPGGTLTAGASVRVWAIALDQYGNGVPRASLVLGSTDRCGLEPTTMVTDPTGATEAAHWSPVRSGTCVISAHTEQPRVDAQISLRISRTLRP